MDSDPELKRWNNRFASAEYLFGTAPNAFLAAQAARLKAGMRALSIADGEGRNGVWLATQGLHVSAFDFSPVGVEKARKLAEQHGVSGNYDSCVAELADWDWDARQYDIIAGIFIQFASPSERAHRNARSAFPEVQTAPPCLPTKALRSAPLFM